MSNKNLQSELKVLMQSFLAGIQMDEKFLIQSQLDLNRILDLCLAKAQSINESQMVAQQKCDIINEKLNRIPKLQMRIEGLSKLFYEAHKRIEMMNKNIANLDKIEQLESEYQGRAVEAVVYPKQQSDELTTQDKGSLGGKSMAVEQKEKH